MTTSLYGSIARPSGAAWLIRPSSVGTDRWTLGTATRCSPRAPSRPRSRTSPTVCAGSAADGGRAPTEKITDPDFRSRLPSVNAGGSTRPYSSAIRIRLDTPAAGDLQQGVLDVALAVPNVRAEGCKAPVHARIGWYRSVYNIFHAFAVGSFIDELAVARGADARDTWLEVIGPARHLDLRELGIAKLENYGESLARHPVDAGRLRRVIERVTDAAHWSDRKRAGRALGLAAHRSFVSYTAVVISVVPDSQRKLRVDEAWICIDAGTVV